MATQGRTALDLWQAREQEVVTLSSGCSSIDELLQGGFRSGILTEVCGEASAGKTQLCLQLLLQSCLPPVLGGLGGSACYICTEGIGSIKRLHELGHAYNQKYGSMLRKRRRTDVEQSSYNSMPSLLDSVFIEQVYEVDELVDVLQSRLPTLLADHDTKLVVIDSVAAVFRLESTGSVKDASERSRLMFHLANCMRILSAQFRVIFVMTNQVTGNFTEGAASIVSTHSNQHKPALGLSWSSCINQRLMLRRSRHTERRVEVVFSPYLPPATARFLITADGITSPDDAHDDTRNGTRRSLIGPNAT
ncbi:hypothetical protein Poli38472_013156 [Pythium oligandrum]|uniref:RecA family profile 1 domain-containing protein n=1 Tax=Pythium oligandrum TaxID=41045 RepID=A0A8K1C2K3_PYTOL|nr:hypothetical protein Poli38472_013156 [Pythium oligandrum]|eukprot:TMW55265.1 hypothetical protein Poli38472_013156 [Pythium oligandrum]